MSPVRFAVPEKCCGLTLILAFFDRCRNCGFPSSATGGGNPQFPRARGRLRAAEGISTREKRATLQALLGPYGEAGRGHHIRPSVRTGAPSPPGEGIGTSRTPSPTELGEQRGSFPLSVNRRADTPVDSSPRGGEPSGVRSILARGPLRGTGGPFGLHNFYFGLHILVYVII